MRGPIFEGLNPEQAAAVAAVSGPVCILAGAGTGKTTTLTRRIANQVATGTFDAGEILAVTFTDKAAREMERRLQRLGVAVVRVRTFHAEALAQYRRFSGDEAEILPSKAQIILPLLRALPPPHRFVTVRDVAAEIERAKNRRVEPQRYLETLGAHRPPIPPEHMQGVYEGYERRKERAGLLDFEDLLERALGLLGSDDAALGWVRGRYRAFSVDEYQDVNLLQNALLEAWVGERRDLCVVGDDYQSIFGFTGATPAHLLGFAEQHPGSRVLRLTTNYRSTPQVLALANALAPRLRGARKVLAAARPAGPAAVVRWCPSGGEETAWIVDRCRRLRGAGVEWEEMAVLFRINARSEELEEAFSSAGIPYQVKDSAFLRRAAARATIARLRRQPGEPAGAAVASVVSALGFQPDVEAAPEEATRQADLGRLLKLAEEYGDSRTAAGFVADLVSRFSAEEDGRGVQILTYHRAKGLEFEAVFLPRLEEGELPFALARREEEVAEERRLFYVGITRAKRHLHLTWASQREAERRRLRRPSKFLDEIEREPSGAAAVHRGRPARSGGAGVAESDLALFEELRRWRLERARLDGVPPYLVFHDRTLAALAAARPGDPVSLLAVEGIGPTKSAAYGADLLRVIGRHRGV